MPQVVKAVYQWKPRTIFQLLREEAGRMGKGSYAADKSTAAYKGARMDMSSIPILLPL
jgi:hypothetical protein